MQPVSSNNSDQQIVIRVRPAKAAFDWFKQGFNIFSQSCDNRACHNQPHFGNAEPMNTGLESEVIDQGLGAWSGIPEQIGEFKSPTLRNVALTAPYMHDGRFATLEEVVDFYSDEVVYHPNNDFEWVVNSPTSFRGFNFSQGQKAVILPVTALYLVAVAVYDTIFVMLRRIFAGKSPFEPDNTHLHHYFLSKNMSQTFVLFIMTSLSAVFIVVGLGLMHFQVPEYIQFYIFVLISALYYFVMQKAWS